MARFAAVSLLLFCAVGASVGRMLAATSKCKCGPYTDTRTPDEICKVQLTNGVYCNSGGHFPVLSEGCTKFFQCDNGNATELQSCGDNQIFDVSLNTCAPTSQIVNGTEVCLRQCMGMLFEPVNGCYNIPSTNTGKAAWGLYNTGEYAVGCGNSGTGTVGSENTGTWAAGCNNSGTASWGMNVTGTGSCGNYIHADGVQSP